MGGSTENQEIYQRLDVFSIGDAKSPIRGKHTMASTDVVEMDDFNCNLRQRVLSKISSKQEEKEDDKLAGLNFFVL